MHRYPPPTAAIADFLKAGVFDCAYSRTSDAWLIVFSVFESWAGDRCPLIWAGHELRRRGVHVSPGCSESTTKYIQQNSFQIVVSGAFFRTGRGIVARTHRLHLGLIAENQPEFGEVRNAHEAACRWVLGERQLMADCRQLQPLASVRKLPLVICPQSTAVLHGLLMDDVRKLYSKYGGATFRTAGFHQCETIT